MDHFDSLIERSPNPERAKIGLSTWLQATGNPALYEAQLRQYPDFASALIRLLGASQAMCDAIAQNPELPTSVLEHSHPFELPTPTEIEEIGRTLLSSSISYQHTLDRLRYLKQRKLFRIALIDVNQWQTPEKVWRALSDLADVLVKLTTEAAWDYHRRMRLLGEIQCPMHVVAYGKHGGREVNYSSDLDIVFVLDDGLDEKLERECLRFGEALIRAFTDRMGRGALYRIDMRLRPYGAAGELAKSMRATEAYYQLYAEAWEVQALIRSRPIVASNEIQERWAALRKKTCFKEHVSEFTTDSILETRERIDSFAEKEDFKRSRGGIRDIEFTVQSLQLVHGHRSEKLQSLGTLEALRNLSEAGLLSRAQARTFSEQYTWLRQLEHRCQLLHDQQTHQLPSSPEELKTIARLIETGDPVKQLSKRRDAVSKVYYQFNHLARYAEANFDLEAASQFLGNHVDLNTLATTLRENEGSLRRLTLVMEQGPALQPIYQRHWELGEALLSGEIEEGVLISTEIFDLYRSKGAIWSKWILGSIEHPEVVWAELLLKIGRREFEQSELKPVFLGSAAISQMSPESDIDLIFFCDSDERQPEIEKLAKKLLDRWSHSQTEHLNPVSIDLRLRPEGSKGLIVRSIEGFSNYLKTDLEPWERYMLGFIFDPTGTAEGALSSLRPWTFDDEIELQKVKSRVEQERLNPAEQWTNVKIGFGGIMDAQWSIRLSQLRSGGSAIFNTPELEFLVQLRSALHLRKLGDVFPSDEQTLTSLAHQFGLPSAEALVQKHEKMRHNVRENYERVVNEKWSS
jgi:glutamate-ammonia-ligase adenylyltransferase